MSHVKECPGCPGLPECLDNLNLVAIVFPPRIPPRPLVIVMLIRCMFDMPLKI